MTLEEILQESAALHRHLCPRQVLGARMGLMAGRLLNVALPQTDKRLLAIVETDGCFVDGLSVAVNCWVGRRTLRVEDYGKVAATLIDTETERALRIVPRATARSAAAAYAPDARSRWEAQLLGYQRMPDEELLLAVLVQLRTPASVLLSRPGLKAICDRCGEEILNERELHQGDRTLCRACALGAYYLPLAVGSAVCDDPAHAAQPMATVMAAAG
jgi:formylmethanofuran dehydrogenase subunit E